MVADADIAALVMLLLPLAFLWCFVACLSHRGTPPPGSMIQLV